MKPERNISCRKTERRSKIQGNHYWRPPVGYAAAFLWKPGGFPQFRLRKFRIVKRRKQKRKALVFPFIDITMVFPRFHSAEIRIRALIRYGASVVFLATLRLRVPGCTRRMLRRATALREPESSPFLAFLMIL